MEKIKLIEKPKLLCMAFHIRETACFAEFSEEKNAPKDHVKAYKLFDDFSTSRFWDAFFEEYPKYKKGYELGIRYNKDITLISVEIEPQTAEQKKFDELIADLDFSVEGKA